MSFLSAVRKGLLDAHIEPGTTALSWGRCAGTFALMLSAFWVTRIVFQTHSLPSLEGITTFVFSPYGVNKLGSAAQSFSKSPVGTPKPDVPPAIPDEIGPPLPGARHPQ